MGERRIVTGRSLWFLRIFALPFAGLGGWGVVCLLTGLAPVTVNERPGTPADVWLPGIFLVIGLVMVGLRWRRVIDGERRTITTTSGWMLWTRTAVAEIGAWQRVEVRPMVERGTGSGRHKAIPVVIVGDRGEHEVEAPRTQEQAQRLAGRVAIVAGLVERDAQRRVVGEPLLARLTAADLEAPEPARNRLRCEDLGLGCRIRIPPSSAIGCGAIQLLVWAAIATGFFHRTAGLTLALIALPAVVATVGAALQGYFGYWVEADPRDGLRMRRRRIAPDELRRLDQQGDGLYAASADDGFLITDGLHDDELRWLRARILRALKG